MTEPTQYPVSLVTAYEYANRPTWCVECEVHRATAAKPLCPVCLDEQTKRAEVAS